MPLLSSCCCCCTVRTGTYIIAIISLIGSLTGLIYFAAISVGFWAIINGYDDLRQNTADQNFWRVYDSVKQWHKPIYGVMVFLAVVHAIMFLTACMLIHGVRKWIAGLMVPWIIVEAFKYLFFFCFGVAILANAGNWAAQIVDLINSNYQYNDRPNIVAKEQYVRAVLISQGAGLVVTTLISLYFFFVVVSHWQQIRGGMGGQEQVKPIAAD